MAILVIIFNIIVRKNILFTIHIINIIHKNVNNLKTLIIIYNQN